MTSTAPPTGHLPSPWRSYLRRGTLPFVVGVLVGLLAAVALLALSPKQFTASAKVLVLDTGVSSSTANSTSGRTSSDINLDTEAQLVTSNAVIAGARRLDAELNRFTLSKLTSRVAITVPPNTTVLQIAFTDSTAQRASDGANAFAQAYLANRTATAQHQLAMQIGQAEGAVKSLGGQLSAYYTKLAGLKSGSPDKSVLNAEITQTENQLTLLNQQIAQLQSIQITSGSVANPATPPHHASSPSRTLYLASGFAMGLLLGLLLAWLRVRFRRTVRTVDDLSHVVDAPCVAMFRRADPTAVGALAAYRHLTVVVSTVVAAPARIVVTSPLIETECSQVAAGLAAALTRRGLPSAVLQVHGDEIDAPRLPSVPTSRVLDADDVFTAADQSLRAALDRIRDDRAMLVIDAPGATVTTDGQVMGAEADAVLVVIAAGTRSRRVRQVIAGLDSVGAPILGTVLVQRSAASRARGAGGRRQGDDAFGAAEPDEPGPARPVSDRRADRLEEPALDDAALDVSVDQDAWPATESLTRTPPANGRGDAHQQPAARRAR